MKTGIVRISGSGWLGLTLKGLTALGVAGMKSIKVLEVRLPRESMQSEY